MKGIITKKEQITPENFAKKLKQIYKTDNNIKINKIYIEEDEGFTSNILRVRITYSNKDIRLPEKLFIKIPKKDSSDVIMELGKNEVDFYRKVASKKEGLPIPQCLESKYSPVTKYYHIILEDLSDTHFRRRKKESISEAYFYMAVESLACFHAAWWDDKRIGRVIEQIPTPRDENAYINNLKNAYKAFTDYMGNKIDKNRKQMYQKALKFMSKYVSLTRNRYRDKGGITIRNGDSHLSNMLFPKNQKKHRAVITDWQFWGIGIGTIDLMHTVALSLTPKEKDKYEFDLVKHYYDHLVMNGIQNYSWEQCWTDYRYANVDLLFMPVWKYAGFNIEYDKWKELFENAFVAFDKLNCIEFLT